MAVKVGEIAQDNPRQIAYEEKNQQLLREKMIARKHRKLYRSMMDGRRKRTREANLLKKKRDDIDTQKRKVSKSKKKTAVAK
jgi:pescadillo protein